MRNVLLCLLIFCSVVVSRAQGNVSARGQRLYGKAQDAIKRHRPADAEAYLLKCIRESPGFADAYTTLGALYCDSRRYREAVDIFRSASQSCAACARSFSIPMARTLCRAARYDDAAAVLAQAGDPAAMGATLRSEYERLQRCVQFGKYALNATRTDTPVNLGARINSAYDEYFPSVSVDDSTLVFTRRTNGVDEDFYRATRDSCGGWFIARDMGSPPNSTQQEGAQMISADGHYLFLMRCGNRSENGWDGGGCDLYFSYTVSDGWAAPVPFGATINTPAFEGMPCLSSDNRELYFVSDREGGQGGKDIWVSRFQDGLWQIPENLGPEINTPYDETAPFIASDNETLYFTSDGHPGLGGNDIFYSRKQNGHWQRPENMGYPFNTAFDEVSAILSADGTKAYFASDRDSGYGRMDLYEAAIPDRAQPRPYTYVFGLTYDSLDKSRLTYAQIEWNDAETGEKLYRYQSNRGDGTYMASLPLNRKYAIHIFRTGYADYDDTVSFSAAHILYPDTLSFPLLSFNYSPPLYDTMLLRFNYVKNNISISDSGQALLRSLVAPYLGIAEAEFFVNGYTDDSGTPVINEELSFARARAVAEWLKSYGISEEKIHTQGWADASPMVPNDTEENRFLNRRVEVTVRKP